MDDPSLMRRVETLADLPRNPCRVVERNRSSTKPFGERLTLNELQHEAAEAGYFVHAVDGGDVRVAERSEELCFLFESRQPLRIVVEGFRQDLDRHVAFENRVAGSIHIPHPAGPEQFTDPVGSKRAARENRDFVGHEPHRDFERRLVERRPIPLVLGEKQRDFCQQGWIVGARLAKKRLPIGPIEFGRLVIELLDTRPAVRIHLLILDAAPAAATL